MKTTAALSRPISGIYTTSHAIDRAYGLAAFLAFRVADARGITLQEALKVLPEELPHYRLHQFGDEMEDYEQPQALDFDIIDRYNDEIEVGGVSYKLPSATSVEFWKRGWVLSIGKNAIELAPAADDVFGHGVARILNCLTRNNGYGSSKDGAYLRDRLKRAFAWAARLASDFEDGRSRADRFDYWHKELLLTARAAYLTLAEGIDFDGGDGLAGYLEGFREAFPEIASKLKIDSGDLTRIESLFTLPGHLVALHAIGESGDVEAKYELWRQAFHLGEQVKARRKELATEFVVLIDSDNVFAVPHVDGGVGLYLETDETIAKELWRFMRQPSSGRTWSALQETFCELLASFMDDAVDGVEIDAKAKRTKATEMALVLGKAEAYQGIMTFIHHHVEDEMIRESLKRLCALARLKPAVMVIRKSDGHYLVLTNGHLGFSVDLRKAVDRLNELDASAVWHAEGQEISGRFFLHMVMTNSGMIQDRRPSSLSPETVKGELGRMVGVIR